MGTAIRPPIGLGSGFAAWLPPRVEIDDPALDVLVEMELDVEDGRLVVTRFTAEQRPGGPPVSIEVLKSMPLVGLAARAAGEGLLSGLAKGRATGPGSTRWVPATSEDLAELPEVERAAVVYRLAYLLGFPPTAAVADELGLSRDVAAKRVQAARQAGLLDPTTKGRKGT